MFKIADLTMLGQLEQLGHMMKGYSENDVAGTLPHPNKRATNLSWHFVPQLKDRMFKNSSRDVILNEAMTPAVASVMPIPLDNDLELHATALLTSETNGLPFNCLEA